MQLNDCHPNDISYLHITSSVATWEEAFPRLLDARHWYSPLSVLLIFVIVIFCLSLEKTILGLSFVLLRDPLKIHDIFGSGIPIALQNQVTLSPSVLVAFKGLRATSG